MFLKIMDNYNQSPYGNEQTRRVGFGENSVEENIVVSNFAKSTLLSISKWVKFLSIVGIVMAVLLIFLGIIFMVAGGTLLSKFDGGGGGPGTFMGGFVGFLYIVIAVLYLYPVLKMLTYSNKMKKAVLYNSQDNYEDALSNFKSGVKFIGILTIIALVIYALGIVGFILGIALQ